MTRAIVGLGQTLNLKLVREGIESAESMEYLRDFGCAQAQGYLFSKPLRHMNSNRGVARIKRTTTVISPQFEPGVGSYIPGRRLPSQDSRPTAFCPIPAYWLLAHATSSTAFLSVLTNYRNALLAMRFLSFAAILEACCREYLMRHDAHADNHLRRR